MRREQFIPRPREDTFAFFADAYNLEAITPPFLRFRILTPRPIAMDAGAHIEYRLRLFGAPIRWRTVIDEFEPPLRFVDRQLSGPYAHWRHVHEFRDAPGGTLMTDTVDYSIAWGPLGKLAHAMFVKRTLQLIFDYRATKIEQLLGLKCLDANG